MERKKNLPSPDIWDEIVGRCNFGATCGGKSLVYGLISSSQTNNFHALSLVLGLIPDMAHITNTTIETLF